MLEPIVRAFADWLESHDQYSVNDCLGQLFTDENVRPPRVKNVWDETRHDWAADGGGELPSDAGKYPALVVRIQNAETMDGRTVHTWEDGVYDLVIECVLRDVSASRAKSQGYKTLRAVLMSLRAFNNPRLNPQNQTPYRKRDGIHIGTMENPRYVPTFAQIPGGYQAGALLVQVSASDSMLTT